MIKMEQAHWLIDINPPEDGIISPQFTASSSASLIGRPQILLENIYNIDLISNVALKSNSFGPYFPSLESSLIVNVLDFFFFSNVYDA